MLKGVHCSPALPEATARTCTHTQATHCMCAEGPQHSLCAGANVSAHILFVLMIYGWCGSAHHIYSKAQAGNIWATASSSPQEGQTPTTRWSKLSPQKPWGDGRKSINSVKQKKQSKQWDALTGHFIASTLLGDVDEASGEVSVINVLKMVVTCSLANKIGLHCNMDKNKMLFTLAKLRTILSED